MTPKPRLHITRELDQPQRVLGRIIRRKCCDAPRTSRSSAAIGMRAVPRSGHACIAPPSSVMNSRAPSRNPSDRLLRHCISHGPIKEAQHVAGMIMDFKVNDPVTMSDITTRRGSGGGKSALSISRRPHSSPDAQDGCEWRRARSTARRLASLSCALASWLQGPREKFALLPCPITSATRASSRRRAHTG